MRTAVCCVVLAALFIASVPAAGAEETLTGKAKEAEASKTVAYQAKTSNSEGSVNIEGHKIDYKAIAGTLILEDQDKQGDEKKEAPSASIFYVAYFKRDAGDGGKRPITFLYNGGPGSSTVWLHMGAFGPKRVLTADNSHTKPAPYQLVNNDFSLLDVSDLVFIDAPATGFSRIQGKEKEKMYFGVDADAKAFADFITQFLSKYGRWNSPKYLFGESYGTTRTAALANLLQTQHSIDLNGVILLSQILNYDNNADSPQLNPGMDLPYLLSLPTYAATAWYHKKLSPQPAALEPFLQDVEKFALGDYAAALTAGSSLDAARRQAIAEKLHQYTSLPTSYILKSDLRINVGQFEKNLLDDANLTTGRLDTRFSGPHMDVLSREADYDPQSASISSAYISAFNDYARKQLKFGEGETFKPFADVDKTWNYLHQPPGASSPAPQAPNVLPDLATAMKYNPNLKVQLNSGYYDLATPFFSAVYELLHLPIPPNLQQNIEYKFYQSGHMVYAHEVSLKELHDNVADFIRRTDNL